MAIQKTEAIVLRATKLRETSLIITFFSREFGGIKMAAKGVRQPGSPWAGLYEPMNRLEVIFYEKFRSDIHLATEATGLDLRMDVRKNLKATIMGHYITEVLENFSNPGEADPDYWELIEKSFQMLPQAPMLTSLVFQLKLLHHSGFFPDINPRADSSDEAAWSNYVTQFLQTAGGRNAPSSSLERPFLMPTVSQIKRLQYLLFEDWSQAFQLKVTPEELAQDEAWVAWLIAAKLEKRLRSRNFLEEILSLTPSSSVQSLK
jgi:DNA repair protein RecO (recombination protein O)